MRQRRILYLLVIGLFLSVAGVKAEQPSNLRWVVKAAHAVDKSQAETIYIEACNFIEDRFGLDGKIVCPVITVHVGEACPVGEISGSCMNPALGVLYLPAWDEESPYAVAQITLMTGLHRLMNPAKPLLMAKALTAH
jgi:hypothetical protein